MFVRLVEYGAIFLIAITVALQIIAPAIRNEPLFPWLKKKTERVLRDEKLEELKKRVDDLANWKHDKEALERRIAQLEGKQPAPDNKEQGN